MNERHKLFCQEMLKNKFNATKAYMAAYPDSSQESARRDGSRLLTNEDVQDYLNELTEKQEEKALVTVEEVINGIKEEIERAQDGDKTHAAVMKGWELLGKYLAIFTENHNNTGECRIVLDDPEEKNV